MNETSKALARRKKSPDRWNQIFQGRCLDIGCGPDPVKKEDWPNLTEVVPFDHEQGDANMILTYFQPESFDVVHGSQVLEHMYSPVTCFREWLSLVKPGGWMIITVPDFDLYEQGVMPSRWNPDHKSTWSLTRRLWPTRVCHIYVRDLLLTRCNFPTPMENYTKESELIDTNYNYNLKDFDQTYTDKGVEAFIEICIHRII